MTIAYSPAKHEDKRMHAVISSMRLNEQPTMPHNTQAAAPFNPIEMLAIFEQGMQIKVINRANNQQIANYLASVAPQLGDGFKLVLPAGQAVSAKLLNDHLLPNLSGRDALLADIDHLANLYADLLGCPNLGVRLEVLNRAMCPKFHVDRTGIRLLCTYVGPGTEWLDDAYADRTKLGMVSANVADSESGLILDAKGMHQAAVFDIALLKGSLWQGNGLRGIIHRSPAVNSGAQLRVMLAIDAIW